VTHVAKKPGPRRKRGEPGAFGCRVRSTISAPLRKIQGHDQRLAPSCQPIGPLKAAPETTPQARAADSENSNSGSALASLQAAALGHLRRERQIQRIHTLGPRVVFELIDELDRRHELGPDLDNRLGRYAALGPGTLRAIGGDRFPASPVRIMVQTSMGHRSLASAANKRECRLSNEPDDDVFMGRGLPADRLGHRHCRSRLDLGQINRTALAVLPSLLARWLPRGRKEGPEYVALNPTRRDRHLGSFRINLRTGRWADFATGDKGGDPVSLAAYLSHLSQYEAAEKLAGMLGIEARHGR